MDILFLGGVFPKDKEESILKKSTGVVQFAANVLQWNIINGLDACNKKPIYIMNSVFIGSYPKLYKDIFIKSYSWSHSEGANDINVGFLNLFGIKQIWRGVAVSRQIKAWAKTKTKEKKAIIIYSMHSAFIFAAAVAKRLNPDIHICLVCPDLPEFMNIGVERGHLFNILKSVDIFMMDKLLKYIDSFVLLTKHMAERIKVGDRNWIVMEGIAESANAITKDKDYLNNENKRIVLYTGTLNKAYGIMELLEAFRLIEDPSINLWICGEGEARSEVEILASSDARVKYFGQVSRAYAIQLQREADILINPRNSKGEYTKFSFPSKIMEYMTSGTPALIYNLPGIPEEYCNYLYTIEGESPVDISRSICRVCNKSKEELMTFGLNAQRFVLDNKSQFVQAQRIIDLIQR